MSDIGSSVMASTSVSSTNRAAKASTRRPFSPIRALAASMSARTSSIGTCDPLQRAAGLGAAGQHHVRSALDELDHPVDAVDRERGGRWP